MEPHAKIEYLPEEIPWFSILEYYIGSSHFWVSLLKLVYIIKYLGGWDSSRNLARSIFVAEVIRPEVGLFL